MTSLGIWHREAAILDAPDRPEWKSTRDGRLWTVTTRGRFDIFRRGEHWRVMNRALAGGLTSLLPAHFGSRDEARAFVDSGAELLADDRDLPQPALRQDLKDDAGHPGHWTMDGMPHRGWTREGRRWVNPPVRCQACSDHLIQEPWVLTHPAWEGVLLVGSTCADALTIPYKDREKALARWKARRERERREKLRAQLRMEWDNMFAGDHLWSYRDPGYEAD